MHADRIRVHGRRGQLEPAAASWRRRRDAGIGNPNPPPSGNVVVQVDAPTSDLVAPAGSLVDVRVNASVDQGNDFIVPTSVKAVITVSGETQELESTQLAPEGMNTFAGRISLGDLATGTYTLTVTAVSSGGTPGSASLDFQIDGGPSLVVRSPQSMRPLQGPARDRSGR